MISRLRMTVLVENEAKAPLVAEHGFAVWIEADETRILFDTGQGAALLPNAAALGVDLRTAQHIVISHGHYDHTGGLAAVLTLAPGATVWVHPGSLHVKYARQPAPPHRSIGMAEATASFLRSRANVVWTELPSAITDGVTATGRIPRRNACEQFSGHFYLDKECTVPDELVDDQALFINTHYGVVLLLGCAHSGVINTCSYVSELAGGRTCTIIGGMHLLNAGQERLDATVNLFRRLKPDVIAPCHCTGERATEVIEKALPESFHLCSTGSSFEQHECTSG